MKTRAKGFTLLEIVIAFAIFAVTATAVMRSVTTGLRASHVASRTAIATLIAESRLAAAGVETRLGQGETSGTTPEGFDWRIGIQPWVNEEATTTDPARLYQPMRVTVTVAWGPPRQRRSVSLTTLRLAWTEG